MTQPVQRRARAAASPLAFALLLIALWSPAEVRAQWSTPDASGNISNTNPGNVKVGGGTAAPTAVVHARGNLTSPLAGTVAVTQNSATVTGTGTNFSADLAVGDSVKIGSEVFTVSAIASATSLTLDSNYLAASGSGLTAYRDPNLFAVDTGDGVGTFTITRSGKVGIGTLAPAMPLTIYDTGTTPYRGFAISQYSTDTNSALVSLVKHRGTTGAPTVVASGDNLGSILTQAYNGSGGYLTTSGISFQVNGTVTSSSIPTDIVFRASAVGAAERMRLTSGGNLGVGTTSPVARMDVRVTGLSAGTNTALWSPSGSADPNTSYVHYGTTGDWYIRPGTTAGRVILADNGGTVGIGTATPSASYKLDVSGGVNASGLCLGGDCKTNWSQVGGGQWTTSGSNVYFNTGNVGLGTTSPARALSINGSGAPAVGIGVGGTELTTLGIATQANNWFMGTAVNDTALRAQTTDLWVGTYSNNRALRFLTNDTQRLVIDGGGKVGIGTTAPGALLDLERHQAAATDIRVTNTNAAGFAGLYLNSTFGVGGTSGGAVQWNNTTGAKNLFVLTAGSDPLYLGTNNTVRMTVLPTSGNVGIGTTSPVYSLDVNGGTNGFRAKAATNSASDALATFENSAGVQGIVRGNGYFGLGTTSPAAKLDVRVTGLSAGSNTMLWSPSGTPDMNTSYVHYGTTGDWYIRPGTTAGKVIMTDAGGTVGIGTSAPNAAYKLDVAGSVNSAGLCLAGDCKTAWSQVGGGTTSQWTTNGSSINYNTGNVGIGSSSPNQKLGVQGMLGLYPQPWAQPNTRGLFMFHGGGGGSIYAYNYLDGTPDPISISASAVDFNTYVAGTSTQRMFIANDGRVGLGTNAPASLLNLVGADASLTFGTAGAADASSFSVAVTQSGENTNSGHGRSLTVKAGDTDNAAGRVGGSLTLNPGAPVAPATGYGNVLLATAGGNVGIGTNTPGEKLEVRGNLTLEASTSPNLYTGTGGGELGRYLNVLNSAGYSSASGVKAGGVLISDDYGYANPAKTDLVVKGRVGIGTSAPNAAYKLDVAGSVNSSGLCLGGDCKTAWSQVGGTTTQWANGGNGSINYGTGFVGIGTTNPLNKLTVTGGADTALLIGDRGTAGSVGLQFLGSGYRHAGLRFDGDSIYVESASISHTPSNWHNGQPLNFIVRTGHVGIGTASPLAPLAVGDASVVGSDGHIVLGKRSASGGTRQMRMGYDANFNFVIGDYGNSNAPGTWTSPFAINWQAPNDSLHINATGKVGIGTASPTVALDVVGDIKATGSVSATYQDVAEWVPSAQRLAAGTVVVLDTEKNNHVMASSGAYDTKVAGVISAQPGVILGLGGEGKVMVATTGRVKVKVDATRGAIKVGDLLVTSGVEGVAMKSVAVDLGGVSFHRPGTIIGKALEPLEKGVGEILVLLSLQ